MARQAVLEKQMLIKMCFLLRLERDPLNQLKKAAQNSLYVLNIPMTVRLFIWSTQKLYSLIKIYEET